MGLDLACVLSTEKERTELHCAVCHCLTDLDSYITQCNHAICKKCCPRPQKLSSCPQCNVKVGELKNFKESQAIAFRILSNVKVRCPLSLHRGCCSWVGPYHQLNWHMDGEHKIKPHNDYSATKGHKKTKCSQKDKIKAMTSAICQGRDSKKIQESDIYQLSERSDSANTFPPKAKTIRHKDTSSQIECFNIHSMAPFPSIDARYLQNNSMESNVTSSKSAEAVAELKSARYPKRHSMTSKCNNIPNRSFEAAEQQLRSDNFELCIKTCNEILGLGQCNAMTYILKACAESEMGYFSKCALTLASMPNDVTIPQQMKLQIGALMELSQTMLTVENFQLSGAYKRVIGVIKRMKTGQSNKFVLLARAKSFLCLGDTNMAITDATAILDTDKRNVKALIIRANALFFNTEFKKALSDCEMALEVDPCSKKAVDVHDRCRHVFDLLIVADKKMLRKSYEKAIKVLSKAIHVAGGIFQSSLLFHKVYLARSKAHLGDKNYKKALKDSNMVLAFNDAKDLNAWKIKIKAMKKMKLHSELAKELAEIVKPGMWGSNHCLIIEAYEEARFAAKNTLTHNSSVPLYKAESCMTPARCA